MTQRNNDMTARTTARDWLPYVSVPATLVRTLIDFAASRGADRNELAACAGIDPAAADGSDARLPFGAYVAVMKKAQHLCGDPALALHFGEHVDLSSITVVGMTGGSAGSIEEALARLNRHAPLAIEIAGLDERLQIQTIDGESWLVDVRPSPNDFPELTEAFFARAIATARRWAGDLEWVKAVHVTHAEPPYRDEYDRIFRVPVVFDSERNALHLATGIWSTLRARGLSNYTSGVLSAHADVLLEKLEQSKTTRGRVEALLAPVLHTGETSIEAVASKLGLSRQTLFRRLKAEGVTFEQVLDELRHRVALQCLERRGMSVNETAYAVGFSEPGAFSRAFRRWTGKSPRSARRQDG